jgi:drug/metabolite transporter (DMT)-like permease
MNKIYGSLAIFVSALLYGSYGVWAVLIGNSFGLFFLTYVRALIAWLIIFLIVILFGHWKKIKNKFDFKILLLLSILGIFTQAVYYSYQIIGIGLSSLFNFTAILISQYLIGYILFKEKISKYKLVSLLLAILGIVFIYIQDIKGFGILAALIAVVAGAAVGTQTSLTKLISQRYSGWQISLFTWASVILFCAPMSLYLGELQQFPTLSLPWFYLFLFAIVGLSIFPIVVYGYKRIPVMVAGLIGLLEIPSAILFGVVFFGEALTSSMIFGSSLILLSAIIPIVYDK